MFCFENNNIPSYIKNKIGLPIGSNNDCKKIISCKPIWGMKNKKEIQDIINSYQNVTNKIIYIFLISDNCDELIIPENVRLYRTSLYKSKQKKYEYLLPYIWENITKKVEPLKKGVFPIIGFCGQNLQYRNDTLKIFSECKYVKCNYIIRKTFWGGNPHDPLLIEQFEDNMINSHFNICNRGNGNFSMRFYQTLSCGRIPILLNTDMVLPFENEINWDDVIIVANNNKELVEKLLHYWNNKNIVKMQIKCKEIYDTYFLKNIFLDRILSS